MKKTVSLLLIVLLLVSLGCAGYRSSYRAVGFVHSNESEKAFMHFFVFEGAMVFALRAKSPCTLRCSAKLETGSAAVYCDCGGGKTELFKIGAGETVDTSFDVNGGKIFLIVETDGTCENGAFDFALE